MDVVLECTGRFTDEAKAFLAEKGFDPDLGARPLGRTIQKFVEDPIAEELLKLEMGEGDEIVVDYDKEANTGELKISAAGAKKPGRKKKDNPTTEKSEESDKRVCWQNRYDGEPL